MIIIWIQIKEKISASKDILEEGNVVWIQIK